MAKKTFKSVGDANVKCWNCKRQGASWRTLVTRMKCGVDRSLCAECREDYWIRNGAERDAAIEAKTPCGICDCTEIEGCDLGAHAEYDARMQAWADK